MKLKSPKKCPYCFLPQAPMSCFPQPYKYDDYLIEMFKCQNENCGNFFLQVYKKRRNAIFGNGEFIYDPITYQLPKIKSGLNTNKAINELSPSFIKIYEEANEAEALGLKEICGIGYRKALEFLIKDYAKKFNESDSLKIETMQLSQVINKYLSDMPQLQKNAKGAVWLGNDETHYVKKFPNKDVQDMKKFITTAVYFIEASLSLNDVVK